LTLFLLLPEIGILFLNLADVAVVVVVVVKKKEKKTGGTLLAFEGKGI